MRLPLACLLLLASACYRPLDYAYEGDGGLAPDLRGPRDLASPSDLTKPSMCNAYQDAASCTQHPSQGCQIYDCCGFKACYGPTEQLPVCAADCIGSCEKLDEANCKATSYCHAIYQGCSPNQTCSDVPTFAKCGQSEQSCNSSGALCNAIPPSCPSGYVPGIANGCYEGCVLQEACCTPRCADKQRCDICWTGYSCIPDGAVC